MRIVKLQLVLNGDRRTDRFALANNCHDTIEFTAVSVDY
jgi:hypothetical protein